MVGGQLGSVKFLETGILEQTSEVVLEPNQVTLTGFAIHPYERRMFVASESGVVWVVDLETHRIDGEPLDASGTELQGVALSPDGSLVVAASRDGGIRIWDTASRRALGPTLKGHEAGAFGIEFGPSGLYTSGFESLSGPGEHSRVDAGPRRINRTGVRIGRTQPHTLGMGRIRPGCKLPNNVPGSTGGLERGNN